MYSIAGFGEMIADRVRTGAYAEALRCEVRPGSVVLDIGTGTGILAMIACQCGARRVYAVDPSDAVQIAIETATDNGFRDRVTVIQRRSTDVTLPERADVIVSDMRGVLPPFQRHLPAIVDARERLLAQGGRLIPQSDTLWASVVEAPDVFDARTRPWENSPFSLNLRAGLRYVANSWRKFRALSAQLLTEPSCWASLDYYPVITPHVIGSGQQAVKRDGTAHGLVVWFDTVLSGAAGFSNAPGAPELIYGQAFFPWPSAVCVREGDLVEYRLRADLVGEDYVWGWESAVRRRETTSTIDVHFRQSTFLGTPLTRESLAKRDSTHVPGLSEVGKVTRVVLDRMLAGASLGDLANELSEQYPERFRSRQEALDFVSELSVRYGQ